MSYLSSPINNIVVRGGQVMIYTNDNNKIGVKSIIERDILMSCGINIRSILNKVSEQDYENIQEIRLRVNKPLMVTSNVDYVLNIEGKLLKSQNNSYIVKIQDIEQTVELMSENSLYAYQEELKNGFLTLKGGHRVGIVGKVVTEKNEIKILKDISGLNIRIARQITGCASRIIPMLINEESVYHTLILSPPNCGKTTMLRDIITQLSSGVPEIGFNGVKVGIVDERSEIAACFRGIPQNDVGIRTDVLDSCPKPQGIIMLVRSMSPYVIATDELGTKRDIDAVEEALNAGIKIITTAHARNINELEKKPLIGELFRQGLFERIVILSSSKGPGTIEDVLDGKTSKSLWRSRYVS